VIKGDKCKFLYLVHHGKDFLACRLKYIRKKRVPYKDEIFRRGLGEAV
jgi:hypothetical protein